MKNLNNYNVKEISTTESINIIGGDIFKRFGSAARRLYNKFACSGGGSVSYEGQSDFVHNSGGTKW